MTKLFSKGALIPSFDSGFKLKSVHSLNEVIRKILAANGHIGECLLMPTAADDGAVIPGVSAPQLP